jgi:transcriptional regulator with XRE-family HTH domain
MVSKAKKSQPKQDINHLVGAHVRLRRMEAGLSQQALADQSGFFRTYISRIEGGTANPTIAVIAALAKVLQVQSPMNDRKTFRFLQAAYSETTCKKVLPSLSAGLFFMH